MEDGMHVDKFGHKRWYLNGLRHREDGPAVIWAGGSKAWFKNDELHREDGPAREWADGPKEWWLNDKEYSFYEWLEKLNISDDDKLFLKLKWV